MTGPLSRLIIVAAIIVAGVPGVAMANTLVDMPTPPVETPALDGETPSLGDVALMRYSDFRGRPRDLTGFGPGSPFIGWYGTGGGYIRNFSFLPYPYSLNGWGFPYGRGWGWGGCGWGGGGWGGWGWGGGGWGGCGFGVRVNSVGFRRR